MKRLVAAAVAAAAVGGLTAAPAQATPIPGCPWEPDQYAWYNPSSGQAPWQQPNWAGTNGIPGTYGPGGYTPVTEQPTPGVCTDFRAACPSS